MKILSLSLFFIINIINTQIYAQEFILEHSDCKIRMKDQTAVDSEHKHKDEISDLQDLISKELGKRNFTINPFIENKRILTGELYFEWKRDFSRESIYHSCIISVAIKKAKGQTPLKSDPTLYSKVVKRRVPRITLRGMERCKLALKESFIHIPTCKKIGFYGEKK